MKSFRWTFALIGAVAVMVVLAVIDFQRSERQNEAAEKKQAVLPVPTDKITRIEVLKRGGPSLVLEKKQGQWQILEPLQDLADEQMVEALLVSFEGEKVLETVIDGSGEKSSAQDTVDLSAYGLDQPVFRLKTSGGDHPAEPVSREVRFGSRAYDGNVYAQFANDPRVLLLSSAWDAHLSKTAAELRDKRLMRKPLNLQNVKAIAIDRAGGTETLMVRVGESWILKRGGAESLPLDANKVLFFLDSLQQLRGQEFTGRRADQTSELARVGLTRASVSVRLFDSDSKFVPDHTVFAVRVGDQNRDQPNSSFAVSSDLLEIVALDSENVDSLKKSAEDFFDRNAPFRFKIDEVARVDVVSPDLKVGFEKNGEAWRTADRSLHREVDASKLTEGLKRLAELEVARFLKGAGQRPLAGAGEKESVIRLSKTDGTPVFEIAWGEPMAEKGDSDRASSRYAPVRTSKYADRFAVTEDDLKALQLDRWLKEPKAAGK